MGIADAAAGHPDQVAAASDLAASPGQLALQAQLLLQRAAVTGDADTYARALASLDRAVASAPGQLDLLAARASTRITTHDFTGAAADAQRVLAANPDHRGGLGAAYDAAFETGQYDDAERFLAALVRLDPASPQVLFRQARWTALGGDPAGAATIAARARAIATTSGIVGTARASYDLLVGKLALDEGRYAIALGAYESALTAAPGWHAALAGLGRARARRRPGGRRGGAGCVHVGRAAVRDAHGARRCAPCSATPPVPGRIRHRRCRGPAGVSAAARGRAIIVSRADRGVDTSAAVRAGEPNCARRLRLRRARVGAAGRRAGGRGCGVADRAGPRHPDPDSDARGTAHAAAGNGAGRQPEAGARQVRLSTPCSPGALTALDGLRVAS